MRANSGHRHPVLGVVTALLVVGVLGTDAWLLSQRTRTTTVDLTAALDRFRAGVPAAPAGPPPTVAGAGTTAPPAEVASSPTTTLLPREVPRGVEAARAPAPAPPAASPTGRPTATAATAPAPRRPAEGVYTYRTSGGEQISTAAASHRYPERTYASVRHGSGCEWEMQSDVIEEHHDHRLLCTEPGRVSQLSQRREVEFFGQRDGFTVVCDPPGVLEQTGEPVGAVTETTCRGEGITSTLVRTFVGEATMSVGGREVAVRHIRIRGDFRGRAEGYAEEEHWMVPGSGLTVRWKRMVDTTADAAFGARVRYRENADFVLESLEPDV